MRQLRLEVPSMQLPWESFQADVHDLFHDKLSKYPAQSYWRTNSPTHFGGATGTFTAIEEVSHTVRMLGKSLVEGGSCSLACIFWCWENPDVAIQ